MQYSSDQIFMFIGYGCSAILALMFCLFLLSYIPRKIMNMTGATKLFFDYLVNVQAFKRWKQEKNQPNQ